MNKTCVVIPCFNEGGRLPVAIFENFLAQNSFTFYFVNDGSTDNTAEVLEGIKQGYPNLVKVINLPANVGKGAAVREGFLTALATNSFKYIGYFDADLATPLEEIKYLLNTFNNNIKMVLGARVLRLGAVVQRDAMRHYMGRIFATLANNVLEIKVYDSQCGAKIFESEIARILFKDPFVSKWLFDLELLYRLKLFHPKHFYLYTMETPLRTWKEKGGSKIKFLDFINAPIDLLKIKRRTPGIIHP
ncbi:hypothetical protein BH23BAC2_BH23BAC2_14340 [soil metagenome]